MGRFSCLVVVLAACAETPVDVPDQGGGDGVIIVSDDGNNVVAAPRTRPEVCGVSTWPEKVLNTNIDLSVATRANNAAIVSMPIGGGNARGMLVDSRMAMVSDQSIATSYDQVGISYAANRYAATTTHSGSMSVWMMADDLTSSDLLTTVEGNVFAKQTILPITGGLVMPVGDAYGVTIHRFADSYEPLASFRLVKTAPVVAMTAASTGSTTVLAWTTNSNCFMGQLDGVNASATGAKGDACPNPRLAVDTASLKGILVFDSPEGVRLSLTDGVDSFGRDLVRAGSSSPRALFDGHNFWVSWIDDDRGELIVGILDTATKQITTTAILPHPSASSYELAMVDGSPWVFTVDGDGYAGHRLCAITP